MLLAKPNDRYLSLKKIYQLIATKPDLNSIFASMRDDDDDYQKINTSPTPGSTTFMKEVTVQAELLWVQRKEKEKNPRPSGDAGGARGKAESICYNFHQKIHFARECFLEKKDCNYCHYRGHIEAECRTKLRLQSQQQ